MILTPLLAMGLSLVAAAPPGATSSSQSGGTSLSNVFNVFESTTLESGCGGPRHPVYQALEAAWGLIRDMNAAALEALTSPEYEADEEYRRLATRFFGIKPDTQVEKKKKTVFESLPTTVGDGAKLNRVKIWYENVQKFIDGGPLNDANKPWLYCSSDFMDLQVGKDVLVDQNHKAVGNKGKSLTLAQWLQTSPRGQPSLNDAWYFKSQQPISYLTQRKSLYPPIKEHPTKGAVPFPFDQKSEPHLCSLGLDAVTLSGDEAVFPAGSSKSQRQQTPRVILCPRAIKGSDDRRPMSQSDVLETKLGPQKPDTQLDDMAMGALTFYHELFHLQSYVYGDGHRVTPDSPIYRLKCDRDSKDQCRNVPKNWWKHKSSFTTSIQSSTKFATGAVASMYLALYDMADPVKDDLGRANSEGERDYKSLYNPENYAWFGYAVLMHKRNPGNFWSTGVCADGAESLESSMRPPRGRGRGVP